MPQNGIRMEGIEAIVGGLSKNEGLEYLDLQDNTATERGSRAIAKSLPSCVASSSSSPLAIFLTRQSSLDRWPKLHTLNLSDCLLRPKGGFSVFRTLSAGSNPSLASLKLQSNELDARAVTELAAAIAAHGEKLVDLELNGNYGEDGTEEQYEKVREALGKWGNEDALDELDELEEQDEDEEEEEVAEASEEDEEEKKEEEAAAEAAQAESVSVGKDADDLSSLLEKAHIA